MLLTAMILESDVSQFLHPRNMHSFSNFFKVLNALKTVSGLWMEIQCLKGELRFASEGHMEQCVIEDGILLMLKWSAAT